MVSLYKNVWKACHSSICLIRFLNGNDIEIVSVSGFKAGDYLVTHDMVNSLQKAEFVEIKFVKEDGHTVAALERLSMHDFNERIITSFDKEVTGFSLLSLADLSFNEIPSLSLAVNRHIHIGQAVALVGFQYDNPYLTIKSGIISTVIHRNGNRYLQFDGSTIWGNSGSPLIDLKTNEVLGVIGYKLDRKNKSYEKMMEISNSNIKMLEKALGEFEVSGVDPIQV
ncbi:MAG TPA: serine protease, partial [Bacteroidales bacterium]|nr:serine protease [Bacteroidales bacterium]